MWVLLWWASGGRRNQKALAVGLKLLVELKRSLSEMCLLTLCQECKGPQVGGSLGHRAGGILPNARLACVARELRDHEATRAQLGRQELR